MANIDLIMKLADYIKTLEPDQDKLVKIETCSKCKGVKFLDKLGRPFVEPAPVHQRYSIPTKQEHVTKEPCWKCKGEGQLKTVTKVSIPEEVHMLREVLDVLKGTEVNAPAPAKPEPKPEPVPAPEEEPVTQKLVKPEEEKPLGKRRGRPPKQPERSFDELINEATERRNAGETLHTDFSLSSLKFKG